VAEEHGNGVRKCHVMRLVLQSVFDVMVLGEAAKTLGTTR